MKGACFPFFLEHYHGMIGKDQPAYFRETPSGKIILAKFDAKKAKNRVPTENQLKVQRKLKEAHEAAVAAIMSAATRTDLENEFKAQSKYSTLLGYVTAKIYKTLV